MPALRYGGLAVVRWVQRLRFGLYLLHSEGEEGLVNKEKENIPTNEESSKKLSIGYA